MTSAKVIDSVNGVQTKRVNVIFSQPVQGVVDDKAADAIALRPVKVDRFSPGRVMGIGEAGSKFGKIISFGAEVVIDHVEHDRHPVLMAGIDNFFKPWDRRTTTEVRRGWRRRTPSFDFQGPLRPA